MEIKKSPKADLQSRKGLFLQVGLIVSLVLVIFVFGWSQSEKKVEIPDFGNVAIEEEIVEITRQEEKQPEPVKQTIAVVSDVIKIVKNTEKIQTNFDFADFGEDVIVVQKAKVVEEKIEDDAPFVIVENMPKFQDGDLNKFRTWVMGRINYPEIAAENNITGKVILEFVIEKDGTLTNIKVIMSPDRSLSDEAVRVLQSSPKWTPGSQRGAPVRVRYTLPVDFKIQQ